MMRSTAAVIAGSRSTTAATASNDTSGSCDIWESLEYVAGSGGRSPSCATTVCSRSEASESITEQVRSTRSNSSVGSNGLRSTWWLSAWSRAKASGFTSSGASTVRASFGSLVLNSSSSASMPWSVASHTRASLSAPAARACAAVTTKRSSQALENGRRERLSPSATCSSGSTTNTLRMATGHCSPQAASSGWIHGNRVGQTPP